MSRTRTTYLNSPQITNQVARKRELAGVVQTAAYLAAQQAYREPRLHDRCTLARLVASCDEVLRVLMNPPKGEL